MRRIKIIVNLVIKNHDDKCIEYNKVTVYNKINNIKIYKNELQ